MNAEQNSAASIWRRLVLAALAMVALAFVLMIVGAGQDGLGLVMIAVALSTTAAVLLVTAFVGSILSRPKVGRS
jgi:hypothetical protein